LQAYGVYATPRSGGSHDGSVREQVWIPAFAGMTDRAPYLNYFITLGAFAVNSGANTFAA